MLPRLSIDDVRHDAWSYAVDFCQSILERLSSSYLGSYFNDLFSGKLSAWVSLSKSASQFVGHILGIICRSTEEKVLDFDASPIIAMVANKNSIWDIPHLELPRDSVSVELPLMNHYHSVSMLVHVSTPIPTTIGFNDVVPKTVSHIPTAWYRAVNYRTVFFDVSRIALKKFTASRTLKLHLKAFFSSVTRASGSSCWLSLLKSYRYAHGGAT